MPCFGGPENPLMMRYHDEEWGVPVHEEQRLFEFLVLEGAQAGLSWQTILRKREGHRRAFAGFDTARVAAFGEKDGARLLADGGIVRNRLKIDAAIENARRFLETQKEFGSFDRYIWRFTGNVTLRRPGILTLVDLPAQTSESEAMSRDLRKRGFRFVGSPICYAFMQAVGMVNDHLSGCFLSPEG
jgi:DNA-3-methyladenine glycosylase I